MPKYFLRIDGLPAGISPPPVTPLQSESIEDAQDEATIMLRDDSSWARDRERWGRGVGPLAVIQMADGTIVSTRPTEGFNDAWKAAGE
jgi:hypothetical protein